MASLIKRRLPNAQSYESLSSSNVSKSRIGLPRNRNRFGFRPFQAAPQISVPDVKKTVDSVRRLRVKNYQNQLVELERIKADLMREQRTMRTMIDRQQISLGKYDASNADLPKLLHAHAEEVRMWEIKCRNVENANKEMQERLPKKESLIYGLTQQFKFLNELNASKHLEEREKLTQHLRRLEEDLATKNKNVAQSVWRLQAELRHVKQQVTMAQKKMRTFVYDLEKFRIKVPGFDKLKIPNFAETNNVDNNPSKLAIIKENPILTEASTSEETDATQIQYPCSGNKKLASLHRRTNQQLSIRRRAERGDGDASTLAKKMSRETDNKQDHVNENSSVDMPLTESSCCSENGDQPSALTEDEDPKNVLTDGDLVGSMESELNSMAPATTTDGSCTEDDFQPHDIRKNTTQLKRDISDLRLKINEDFNKRMDTYSRSFVTIRNTLFTDESDADNQGNTSSMTEIDERKPKTVAPIATTSAHASKLLASLKINTGQKENANR